MPRTTTKKPVNLSMVKNVRDQAVARPSSKTPPKDGTKKSQAETVVIPRMDLKMVTLKFSGENLLVNRFSPRAVAEMEGRKEHKASAGKEAKNPQRDYEESIYRDGEGNYLFPANAFRKSAIAACTSLGKGTITKVLARQSHRILDDMAILEGEPIMDARIVRINGKTPDMRYRGLFKEWSTTLTIEYNARAISLENLINLYSVAGFAVGVGEFRMENGGPGTFGCFTVGAS